MRFTHQERKRGLMADQVWSPSFDVFKKGFRISFDVFVFEGLVGPAFAGLLFEDESRMFVCQNYFFKAVDAPDFSMFLYLDYGMHA
jgi:hypothetical protein